MMGIVRQSAGRGASCERGFSLLEGMMASAILSVGLLALAAMQGLSMVKNVDAEELTRMTAVASDILERIQFNRRTAASYSGIDVTASAGNCGTVVPAIQIQARGDCLLWGTMVSGTRLESVRGQITVSNVLAPAVLAQRDVTVTLTWMGSQRGEGSVKRPRTLTLNRRIAPE